MAQFDVHRNKGPLKESVPFVVVVQSSLFDRYRYRRRMAVPLVRRTALPGQAATVGSRLALGWNPSLSFCSATSGLQY